jgi:hypothetical protein
LQNALCAQNAAICRNPTNFLKRLAATSGFTLDTINDPQYGGETKRKWLIQAMQCAGEDIKHAASA